MPLDGPDEVVTDRRQERSPFPRGSDDELGPSQGAESADVPIGSDGPQAAHHPVAGHAPVSAQEDSDRCVGFEPAGSGRDIDLGQLPGAAADRREERAFERDTIESDRGVAFGRTTRAQLVVYPAATASGWSERKRAVEASSTMLGSPTLATVASWPTRY